MYLLWGVGDCVKDNPWVVQFVLNCSISTFPLGPPFGRAEVYVFIDLLLLNIGEEREDVTVAVSVCRIDIPNPLINIVERCQMLFPLH